MKRILTITLLGLLVSPATAQTYYKPQEPHHHSCYERVRKYCPDLPPGRGVYTACAARYHMAPRQFCTARLRVAPPVHGAQDVTPPLAPNYSPRPAVLPTPAPGYYER